MSYHVSLLHVVWVSFVDGQPQEVELIEQPMMGEGNPQSGKMSRLGKVLTQTGLCSGGAGHNPIPLTCLSNGALLLPNATLAAEQPKALPSTQLLSPLDGIG